MVLRTPIRIRTFQRKLYRKAKQNPQLRFYALYDKIYRDDILNHAYQLVRANGGSAGVDGITAEKIEKSGRRMTFLLDIQEELKKKTYKPQPVRRVLIPKADGSKRPLGIPTLKDRVVQMATKLVIEPIFEADFCENSYGFRPKKSAHDAIDDVKRTIRNGNVKVIDADLSKYFDTIPHTNLLKTVAKRIIDRGVLHLIKMWLKVPVVEEGEDGKKRITGGKKNQQGTPQGGVISPLLANIYLHLLDSIWEVNEIEKRYNARLIRYADDCVILCKYGTDKAMKLFDTVLKRLGLSLNEKKTSIINVHHGSFDFLGFTLFMRQSRRTKRRYLHIEPSRKSQNKIKERLRTLTQRNLTILPLAEIVDNVNKALRGWVNYFHHYNCSEVLNKVKNYTEERIRIHLCRRHKIRDRKIGILKYPRQRLYEVYKLYKVPQTAVW